ncbi:MAG: leucine-rich repeat domain-containing protein [Acetobacter sp.]|nr:leucine-rich repeat domain-containing protein [Bacteroides sp.]MCM1340359.1 leucine-rich repeat domain-containing protein [Acetobacter sp.]MCM1432994.1 leucine-rich repeat domain-containing protein [Clostridiales bacterium]
MNLFLSKILAAIMSLICAINLATPVGYKVPKVVHNVTPYSSEATEGTGYDDETDYELDNKNEENPETPDTPDTDDQDKNTNEETKNDQAPATPAETPENTNNNENDTMSDRAENVLGDLGNTNDTANPADEDEINVEDLEILDTIDISATENDNVTLTLYADAKQSNDDSTISASKKAAATVDFNKSEISSQGDDGTPTVTATAVVSGDGNMEDNVYRHFVDIDKFIDSTEAAIAECYGLEREMVTHYTPEGLTDLFEVDEHTSYFTTCDTPIGPEGITLAITDEVREAIIPATMLKFAINEISFKGNITNISDGAFLLCDALTDITIPETVKTIGENAFSYCSNLKNVVIPEGVECIKASAFMHCDNLETVTLPSTINYIGDEAFSFMMAGSKITCATQEVRGLFNYYNVTAERTTVTVAE